MCSTVSSLLLAPDYHGTGITYQISLLDFDLTMYEVIAQLV